MIYPISNTSSILFISLPIVSFKLVKPIVRILANDELVDRVAENANNTQHDSTEACQSSSIPSLSLAYAD
jgi:hypothetical protein